MDVLVPAQNLQLFFVLTSFNCHHNGDAMNVKLAVILFSFFSVLCLWTADAAIDAFLFHQGTFAGMFLFDVSPHEFLSRSLLIVGLTCYGIVSARICNIIQRKKAGEELRARHDELEQQVAKRTGELNAVNELLHQEIQDRTRTEEELCRSESFLRTIFDSIHDPFSIVDRDYRIVKLNAAYARLRNRLPGDLQGEKCYEVLCKGNSVCEGCAVERTFRLKKPCTKEKVIMSPDVPETWIDISTYPIFDRNRNITHVIEYARDVTVRKKAEEEKKLLLNNLNHLSTTDGLTGLFNRRALTDILQHEIERAERYVSDLSLLLCDIDKFKSVNDTYGHAAGDKALQAVAESLKIALRKSDILGRYGGDEFMIILPETSLDGAKKLAEKIRGAVNEISLELPMHQRISLSVSVGVASCCAPMENIDTLVKLADTALYTSKHEGRNMVSAMQA